MLENYINSKIKEAYIHMQNNNQMALETFNEVLELEPDNIDALNGKGSTLMRLDQYDEAEKFFNKSLSLIENTPALLNKGLISQHQNNYDKALKYYDKVVKMNPELKSIINILKNDIPDETSIYFKNKTEKLINRGIELKNENKLFDAYDMLMKAKRLNYDYESRVNELTHEIRVILEKEFIYEDDELDTDSKTDRLKMQAQKALIKENNPQKALLLMNLLLKINENDLNILNHKGGVLFICGKYHNAIDCFNKCIETDRDYSYILFNKAIVLRLTERLNESLKCFDEMMKIPEYQQKVKPYQMEILNKIKRNL